MKTTQPTAGLLAEFGDTDALIAAARRLHAEGYRQFECYTPFPVEGLAEAMEFRRTRMPLVVLCGALLGLVVGYGLQYWTTVIEYPLNIGGRPLHSWPSFVPVTFELTILTAALFAVLGMLGLNGLPRPHHPLFHIREFSRASSDAYFLWVKSEDPQFHEQTTREALRKLQAQEVWDVPSEP
ncbi:MAG: DUF3341 domain-containing protein [Planctomycetota bacterium]|nr:MAG: DUF3341 domain-containing protein [Planctomycetota bacterium]REJ88239.1 MAG: DUF3341 domain-containing protein [Planctomycetota bacterium]REK24560.1 MAG: DUF3341 domain-containing protein [Planctomycetota bacterium]REK32484.1 MAG: DUF3341 domain-containing protein [Planctomycetota bacterium]